MVDSKMYMTYLKLFVCVSFIISVYYYSRFPKNQNIKMTDDLPKLKYILQWISNPNIGPFSYMGEGQSIFFKLHCPVTNCYITLNRNYLERLTDFDALLFHSVELFHKSIDLPNERSPHQKYIFLSMESSHYYPIVDECFENFFNWTWTYKLNSDLYYGYMIIKNRKGKIIGPSKNMQWLKHEEMEPIDDVLKQELSVKTKVAAWFASNCNTPNHREKYVSKMIKELALYNMTVDVYGKCGFKKCSRANMLDLCSNLIKRNYYFYLSFENSFAEDYVTKKLLIALHNNAIPVVFGGANYTRFLPDGAYLDARKLNVKDLVKKMVNIMEDNEKYYDFFKWRNHYSYQTLKYGAEFNCYCRLCSKLNEKNDKQMSSVYKEFRRWWNPHHSSSNY